MQLRKKASSGFLRHHHCRYAPVLQNLKDYMTQGIKALLEQRIENYSRGDQKGQSQFIWISPTRA